ncbi:MAG: DUF3553 domain-containing protein [Planctomycetota bacterium]
MSSAQTWKSGDRVVHTGKPEWGVGKVIKAEAASHEGAPCQRLSIRFGRAGAKTISTAFARLESAGEAPVIESARDPVKAALAGSGGSGSGSGPRGSVRPAKKPPPGMLGAAEAPPDEVPLDPVRAREIMTRVPEAARDPFRSLADRVRATLKLYTYQPSGGSLIDWASTQSGAADPLSLFNRHELEQMFDRFAIERDQHLGMLVGEARRAKTDIGPLFERAPSHARRVLSQINRRR